MDKNIKDILFVIQARTQSTRVPNKMLKPFGESNLFEIAIQKILNSKNILGGKLENLAEMARL